MADQSQKPTIMMPVPAQAIPVQRCENCKFAHLVKFQGRPGQIECRRFPPIVHPLAPTAQGIPTMTAFPVLQPNQFCGEWKPKLQS